MSIALTNYVNITSGVGAAGQANPRDLIGRIFTINPLVPTGGAPVFFTNAAEVGNYFGTDTEEYERAAFYFGWISKSITSPLLLSFAHWAAAASAPLIYGVKKRQALANYTSITNGSFFLTIGTTTNSISGLDFTAAVSLTDVATIIQDTINEFPGAVWVDATVIFDAVGSRFVFTGGATGPNAISVQFGTIGTDVSVLIGWTNSATYSNGSAAESLTQALINSVTANNNFGSFCFTNSSMLSLDQYEEIAAWNVTNNNTYQFMVPLIINDAADFSETLIGYAGTALTISETSGEYPEQIPMMILAATNYYAANGTQNYMYQQFNVTPSVTDTLLADTLNALRVNYYGETQANGQKISFYQIGVLMGLPTDAVDQNVYANEQWLKDSAAVNIINLLLALTKVSANANGAAQIRAVLQDTIDTGILNGTISLGKPLTTQQKLYIANFTGSQTAWHQIQLSGYWANVTVNPTTHTATYALLYSKDDDIRKVEGTHVLI